MSLEDIDYFTRRAELQLELAQRSANPVAVAAHCAIADSYLELSAREVHAPDELSGDPRPS